MICLKIKRYRFHLSVVSIYLCVISSYLLWKKDYFFKSLIPSDRSDEITSLTGTPTSNGFLPIIYPEASSLTEIPNLIRGLSWQISKKEPSLRAGYLEIGGKIFNFNLKGGQEWTARKDAFNNIDEQIRFQKDLAEYYDSPIKQIGWSDRVNVHGITFRFRNAEGPTGWDDGYVGVKGNNIRVVFLSESQVSLTDNKVGLNCPCYMKYTLFLSDIIPVERIISLTGTGLQEK
jgi:hypothetical protein